MTSPNEQGKMTSRKISLAAAVSHYGQNKLNGGGEICLCLRQAGRQVERGVDSLCDAGNEPVTRGLGVPE